MLNPVVLNVMVPCNFWKSMPSRKTVLTGKNVSVVKSSQAAHWDLTWKENYLVMPMMFLKLGEVRMHSIYKGANEPQTVN